MEPTEASGGSADHAEAEGLKATARWLVAAGASVGALVVAGTQLKDLAVLDESDAFQALGAAGLALLGAGVLIFAASRVLQTYRPPIASLKVNEPRDADGTVIYTEDPQDKFLKLVMDRRNELLGPGRDSITSLDIHRNRVYNSLYRGQVAIINGQRLDPNDASDLENLRLKETDISNRINLLRDAAELFETRRRFNHLLWTFVGSFIAFVVGAFYFVYLTSTATAELSVQRPTRVSFIVPTEASSLRQLGLSSNCAGRTLTGFAIGGSYDAPIIVSEVQENCPPALLKDTTEVVVVPTVP